MARSESFRKYFVGILLGAAVLYQIGSSRIPLWDRDEPWYAECSREMLQSGNWVVPTYLTYWRFQKPPLTYWCQATVMAVAESTALHGPLRGSVDAWAARFPSTVAVVLTVLLLGVVVRYFVGNRRALWSAFIFATAGLTIAASKMAITDGLLLLFAVIGQACLALMYSASLRGKQPPWWTASVFWIALGLAGLVKGPQPVGMHAFTMFILLVLDVTRVKGDYKLGAAWRKNMRWWSQLKPAYGVPILVAVVSPWLILVHQRAPGFLNLLINIARKHAGSAGMDGHGEPPGYHAILIFGTFFPWSILLPTAVAFAFRHRRTPHIRFAIACVCGPWLLMDIFVGNKLPFYVIPAFPALSFLTADALLRCARGQYDDLHRPIFKVAVGIWAFAVVVIGAAPWVTLLMAPARELPITGIIGFTGICFAYAALVYYRFRQGKIERAAIIMGVGMAMALLVLFGSLFPNFRFMQLPARLADDLTQLGAYGNNVPVAMIGYQEPSLAFYQGGGAREVGDGFLNATPPEKWPRWMVITQQSLKNAPAEFSDRLVIRATEQGISYNASHAPTRKIYVVENLKPGRFLPTTMPYE